MRKLQPGHVLTWDNGRVELVPGWFDESLTDETRSRLGIERASVIMMDCVLEASTLTALEF